MKSAENTDSAPQRNDGGEFAQTYLGRFGAVLPLLVMIGSMIVMVALGYRSSRNFWAAGFFCLVAGFLVYKDKEDFTRTVTSGLRDHVLAFMTACFLLAGVMSQILAKSHLVDALLYILLRAQVPLGLIPLICFLIATILSTSTGSAATAVNATGPILLPLAVGMGCDVNLICGAILAGSCFGDNLAPISDTTIASSLTQEVDTMKVVRSRLKYSLIAGACASIGYIVVGVISSSGKTVKAPDIDGGYLPNLVFLIVPVLAIILMLRKQGVITAFLVSELVGFVMLFAFGYLDWAKLVDADEGLIPLAFNGMTGSIIFLFFIFIMVSIISRAGVLDMVLNFMKRHASTGRTAEAAAGAMVSIISIAISSGTSAITFCGPIIRKLLRPFRIARTRCANILDGLGCGVGYLVPTNPGCLNLAAVAVASGVVGKGFNPITFVGYNFQSIALIIVFWGAILTGWGRKYETEEELLADGASID